MLLLVKLYFVHILYILPGKQKLKNLEIQWNKEIEIELDNFILS